MISVTDPRGLVTSYVYDGFGHVIQQTSPDTGVTVYEVDLAGNRTKQTDARDVVADFTYDALNRVTAKTFPAASAENVAYLYDQVAAQKGIGRLTSVTDASGGTSYVYDHRGNVVSETRTIGASSYTTAYAYDLADHLSEVTYPSGRIVSYARDAIGRVSAITTQASALASPVTVASSIAWMPFGPLKGLTYGNGLDLALSYDQDYRLTALTTAAGATTIQSLSYGYDAVGNITSITDSVNASRSQTYGYDNHYRLTSATGLYGTFGFSYDAVGNRLTRTRTGGAGALSETYSYAATSNRLLSVANGSTTRSFSYTSAGNISLDDRGVGQDYGLVYSNDNRLAELTQASQSKATYANSDAGERVRKTLPGSPATTTHYVYDRDGVLIDEDDGTGTAQREYIHLAGLPLALIAGGQLAFVHMDHLGTPQAMTDGTQAQVWDIALRPFGTAETQTGTLLNPQRFPGQLADDEAGYHDNVWRTYDPSLGRYLQSDPIGLRGGLNTFAYVGGNPLRKIDFWGLAEYPADFIGPLRPDDCYSPIPTAPSAADVDANMDEAGKHYDPLWFRNQVKNKGPWDYKQQGSQYQNFGNFNYGATGRAFGGGHAFSETRLLREAGRAQQSAGTSRPEWGDPGHMLNPWGGTPPFGDDPADAEWIKRGMEYFKNGGKKGCGCK